MADPLAALARLEGVGEAVDASRASIDALLREPVLRRRRGEVVAESLRRGACASATLFGGSVPLADFQPPFPDTEDGQLAAAVLRSTTQLGSLANVWRTAPLQALARLHTLLAADFVEPDELGRPRSDEAVQHRLALLADLVVTPTAAPALVMAAAVYGELATLQPFAWGSDLVARAALRLCLIAPGIDPDSLSVPEAGVQSVATDTWRSAYDGYVRADEVGVAHWVVVVAAAVSRGASIGREICHEVAASA